MLSIRWTKDTGRGVFAERAFQPGDLIERAPVIAIPLLQVPTIEQTVLHNFWYRWGVELKQRAVVLGFGMLYNHSYQPNAYYVRRLDDLAIDFIAQAAILEGDEICVNYNGRVDDLTEIVFEGESLRWPE